MGSSTPSRNHIVHCKLGGVSLGRHTVTSNDASVRQSAYFDREEIIDFQLWF